MNQLETDYPTFNFVYMTGHLDGSETEHHLYTSNNANSRVCPRPTTRCCSTCCRHEATTRQQLYPNGSDACEVVR